jgi:hypothetical protein
MGIVKNLNSFCPSFGILFWLDFEIERNWFGRIQIEVMFNANPKHFHRWISEPFRED